MCKLSRRVLVSACVHYSSHDDNSQNIATPMPGVIEVSMPTGTVRRFAFDLIFPSAAPPDPLVTASLFSHLVADTIGLRRSSLVICSGECRGAEWLFGVDALGEASPGRRVATVGTLSAIAHALIDAASAARCEIRVGAFQLLQVCRLLLCYASWLHHTDCACIRTLYKTSCRRRHLCSPRAKAYLVCAREIRNE